MAVTIEQFAASGPQLTAIANAAVVDGLNAAAHAIATDTRRNLAGVLGPDMRLSHKDGKPKVGVFYRAATTATLVVDIVGSGPWWLLEQPRRGGYTVTAKGKALRTPHGPFRRVKPGPVTNPPAPIRRTIMHAVDIVNATAPGAVARTIETGMVKLNRATIVVSARG